MSESVDTQNEKTKNEGRGRSHWNSLEIAKLIASISLPLVVAVFGFWMQKTLREIDYNARASEALVRKRQEVYDKISTPMNNVYCYIEEVGGYKGFTPDSIIEDRRKIHQVMHINRVYWSSITFDRYLRYMDEIAFSTWEADATDAKIQAHPGQKVSLPSWREEWRRRFTTRHPEHRSAYAELAEAIAVDLGVDAKRASAGQAPRRW